VIVESSGPGDATQQPRPDVGRADSGERDAFPQWSPGGPRGYQELTAGASDMSIVLSADKVLLYVSPASRRLFGWSAEDLENTPLTAYVHPDDEGVVCHALNAPPSDDIVSTSFRFRSADGCYRWVDYTGRVVRAAHESFIAGTVRDTSARQAVEVELVRQASTDPLTGLANRSILVDRLAHGLRRRTRTTGLLAVLFLDLDQFKLINDSLGHTIGDRVLVEMATRLARQTRASDTLARIGGDEFVIIAEQLQDTATAIQLAQRLVETAREPIRINGETLVCTVSVGITIATDSHLTAEDLIQEADLALYKAKNAGRDQSALFDDDLRATAVGRLGTERMLRHAITDSRIRVAYQPIIDLGTRRITSAEALVRIDDPTTGVELLPHSFIDVAEQTGILDVIDDQVFAEALRQARDWRCHQGFHGINVNLTARHLARPGFTTQTVDDISAMNLPPDHLHVEVSEKTLLLAAGSALTGLYDLHGAGVKIGIDEFGIGYSSLAYLRRLPLDFIKIDRVFLQDVHCEDSRSDRTAILAAIIDLAHALRLTTVAEGVETLEQLDLLTSLDCDRAQGFLLARPSRPEDVTELLKTGQPLQPH